MEEIRGHLNRRREEERVVACFPPLGYLKSLGIGQGKKEK